VNKVLENDLEKEFNDKYLNPEMFSEAVKNMINELKIYGYENVFMDNYGVSILDKNNNLIGYKINDNECATLEIYYNTEGKFCNKVSIKEFDENTLTVKDEVMIS